MPRKRREESSTRISASLQARIEELAQRFWSSNRSQMARDLGSDQSTVSKVLTRKQEPSAKFLEKLAAWPGVNAVWLFSGEGEPQAEGGIRPGVGSYRPVLDELLPGRLAENRERLSGVGYPVAAAFDSRTAYWYRVPPNSPVTTKSKYGVRGGDLLLMETADSWTRKSGAVADKFCVLRYKAGRKEIVELGWVDAISKTNPDLDQVRYEQFAVDRFVAAEEKAAEEKAWLIVPTAAGGDKDARRSVSGICLSMSEIVGVCLKLDPPFVSGANQGTRTPRTGPRSD